MGTCFHEVREPWDRVEVEKDFDGQYRIRVWEDGIISGTLFVKEDGLGDAIRTFAGEEVGKRTSRGAAHGTGYTEYRKPRTDCLISERAEIVAARRPIANAHRKDGEPWPPGEAADNPGQGEKDA